MSTTFLPQKGRESLLYLQQNNTFFCHQKPLLSLKQSQVLQTKQGQTLLFGITPEDRGLLALLHGDGTLGQRQQLMLPAQATQSECCFFSQGSTGTHCYFVGNQTLFSCDFASSPKELALLAPTSPLRFFDATHPVLGFLSPKRQQMIFLPEEGQTILLSNDGDAILDYSALWHEGILHLCYLYGNEKTARLFYRQVKDGVADSPQLLYTASALHQTALFVTPDGLFVSAAGQNRLLYTFSQTNGKTFFPVSRHYAPFAAAQKATCLSPSHYGECYVSAQFQVLDTGFFRPSQTGAMAQDLKQTLQKKDQTIHALQTELNRQKQAEQNARTQLLQQSSQWSSLRNRLEQEIIALQQKLATPAKAEGVILAAGYDISQEDTPKAQAIPVEEMEKAENAVSAESSTTDD